MTKAMIPAAAIRASAAMNLEGFEHHGLRQRLQRAAGSALKHAEKDQHGQALRQPAQKRCANGGEDGIRSLSRMMPQARQRARGSTGDRAARRLNSPSPGCTLASVEGVCEYRAGFRAVVSWLRRAVRRWLRARDSQPTLKTG